MKYLFRESDIKNLDKKALEYGNIFQSSNWAVFKKKYGHRAFSGFDENGNEILSCLMLIVPVYPTFMKIGYIVRGFVGDMTDSELVSSFTEYLKDYMKKHHIIYVIIDPYESYKTDFILTEEGAKRHKNLLDCGYIHFPQKAYSLQRPTNYRVTWDRTKSVSEQENEVWSKMKKVLQNSIKTAENRGLEPVRFSGGDISEEVFSEFLRLFHLTAENKHFGMKSEEYYRDFLSAFRDYTNIYFFKYNAEKDRAFTENTLEELKREICKIENLEEKAKERKKAKLAELKDEYKNISGRLDTIEKYKNENYLSSFYTVNFGRRCQLYFGANSPVLRELKLTANYWPMLKDCFGGVCDSFDMGGTLRLDTEDIKKDKTYDLYLYKSRYGGVLDELLGEYYLVGNRFLYKILHEKLHYFRRYALKF